MEEFIEEDVISHLKDNNYMFNPIGESKTVKAILKIIEELQLNHGENVNYNEVFTQNRNRIIAKVEEKDSQLMLMVIQNIEDKILREVSRMKKTFTIMEKLTSKFDNMNNDTEYWLKKLRKLKANDLNQVMKMADSVNEIFGEMEDAGVNLTEREKLKYMFNILPNDFKKHYRCNLRNYRQTII